MVFRKGSNSDPFFLHQMSLGSLELEVESQSAQKGLCYLTSFPVVTGVDGFWGVQIDFNPGAHQVRWLPRSSAI